MDSSENSVYLSQVFISENDQIESNGNDRNSGKRPPPRIYDESVRDSTIISHYSQRALNRGTISLDEFHELYNIEFDLNPKNLCISMKYESASEPVFIVNLLVKLKFNSIVFWKEIKYEDDEHQDLMRSTRQFNLNNVTRSQKQQIMNEEENLRKKGFIKKTSFRQSTLSRNLSEVSGNSSMSSANLVSFISAINNDKENEKSEISKEESFAGITKDENFSKYHLLPIPTIRAINTSEPGIPTPDTFHLRKLPIDDEEKERLDPLMKKATKGNGKNSNYCLKLVKYEATQMYYNFEIPFDGYTKTIKRFPLDTHIVKFAITFKPIFTYCNADKTYFELKVGENKGSMLKEKGYYYPKVRNLKEFPLHSYALADERVLDFDIVPESLQIHTCDYGQTLSGNKRNKKKALRITFSLYRLITAPFINLFLPIYIIAILVPFSWWFRTTMEVREMVELLKLQFDFDDRNEREYFKNDNHRDTAVDFDVTATFLSTLLLTLVAHRHVISSSQVAAIAFTTCDRDFLICLVLIVFQMSFFLIKKIIGRGDIKMIFFFVEEALLLLFWILPRSYILLSSTRRNMRTQPMLLGEYMHFRRDIRRFQLRTMPVQQKTYFSTSIKLIAGYDSHLTKRVDQIDIATPTDDLYRIRLFNNDKARGVLKEIMNDPFFQEEYTEELDREEGSGMKILYSHTMKKTMLLEVEIIRQQKSMENMNKETELRRYRKSKLEKLSPYSTQLSCLTKGQARWLFYTSCAIEVYSMFVGNRPQGKQTNKVFTDLSLTGIMKRSWFNFILLIKEWLPRGIIRRMRQNFTRIQEDGKLLDVVIFLLDKRQTSEDEIDSKIESFFSDIKHDA